MAVLWRLKVGRKQGAPAGSGVMPVRAMRLADTEEGVGESLGGLRGRSVSQDCLLAPRHCLRQLAGIIALHPPCWLTTIAEDEPLLSDLYWGGGTYTVSRWLGQDLNLVPLDRTGALKEAPLSHRGGAEGGVDFSIPSPASETKSSFFAGAPPAPSTEIGFRLHLNSRRVWNPVCC